MTDLKTEAQLRQELATCWQLIEQAKADTKRLDLLVKLLETQDLHTCRAGYTFFPKESVIGKYVTQWFFPTIRELLDSVQKEYK